MICGIETRGLSVGDEFDFSAIGACDSCGQPFNRSFHVVRDNDVDNYVIGFYHRLIVKDGSRCKKCHREFCDLKVFHKTSVEGVG